MARPAVSFDLDGVIMRGPWSSTIRPSIWNHLAQSPGLAHLVAEDRERQIWTEVRAEHDRRLAAGEFVSAWDWQSVYDAVCRAWNGNPVPNVASLVRHACAQPDTIAL